MPKSHDNMVAAVFRMISAKPDPDAVSQGWDELRDQVNGAFSKVGRLMDSAKTEVLAFTGFLKAHWRKI